MPVRSLRSIARKHGLTPKGGFRLAKAPAHVLAPLLAELREPEALDEVVQALSASAIGEQGPLDLDEEVAGKKHGSGPKPSEPEITPAMRRKDEEAIQLRGDLEMRVKWWLGRQSVSGTCGSRWTQCRCRCSS